MEENKSDWKKLIVRVFAKTTKGEKYCGTAFLINKHYLLTARHVIEPFREDFATNKDRIVLRNGPWDGDQYLAEAPIPHDNPAIDIALLRLRMPNPIKMEYWRFMECDDLSEKPVRIAGFDNERDASTAPSFESLGNISQFYTVTLQNKGQHGKSGGPVFIDDRIVGILYARTDAPVLGNDQNQTFIYPYCVFKEFLSNHELVAADHRKNSQSGFEFRHPDECVALIDREDQWDMHIEHRIKTEKDRKTFAFVVAGVTEEWPESLELRLRRYLQIRKPCTVNLRKLPKAGDWEKEFWVNLLALLVKPDSGGDFDVKSKLREVLSEEPTPVLFYWYLPPKISSRLGIIRDITKAWESLDLPESKQQHFLLIVYGTRCKRERLDFCGIRIVPYPR